MTENELKQIITLLKKAKRDERLGCWYPKKLNWIKRVWLLKTSWGKYHGEVVTRDYKILRFEYNFMLKKFCYKHTWKVIGATK